jgi:type II secretory pathway predicted ATPase ExeA
MLVEFYKLAEQPFGVTPDTRYLYLSPTHSEAMASVVYGVLENRGFTALIAHPGMGKTTLLFDLLERIHVSTRTVFLFQAQLSPYELMRSLLADLGIPDSGQDVGGMQLKLNDVLLRETGSGKKVVIVIDEAQTLDEKALEVLRMLSNFETSREKLIHVVLAGQPQLAERLASPSMIQLRQRISIVARLAPFDAAETRAYIEHRLRVAGHKGWRPIFTDHAYALIAQYSRGIPRNINNLCFNAMSLGCALRQRMIGHTVIQEVLRDLDLRPLTLEVREVLSVNGVLPSAYRQSPKHSFWSFRKRLALLTTFGALTAVLRLPVPLAKPHLNDLAAERDALSSRAAIGSVQSDWQYGFDPSSKDQAVKSAAAPQQPASSGKRNLPPSEPLYRICIRSLSGYLAYVFQELERWNPLQQDPKETQQGQVLSGSGKKPLTVRNSPERATAILRLDERRNRS